MFFKDAVSCDADEVFVQLNPDVWVAVGGVGFAVREMVCAGNGKVHGIKELIVDVFHGGRVRGADSNAQVLLKVVVEVLVAVEIVGGVVAVQTVRKADVHCGHFGNLVSVLYE